MTSAIETVSWFTKIHRSMDRGKNMGRALLSMLVTRRGAISAARGVSLPWFSEGRDEIDGTNRTGFRHMSLMLAISCMGILHTFSGRQLP